MRAWAEDGRMHQLQTPVPVPITPAKPVYHRVGRQVKLRPPLLQVGRLPEQVDLAAAAGSSK